VGLGNSPPVVPSITLSASFKFARPVRFFFFATGLDPGTFFRFLDVKVLKSRRAWRFDHPSGCGARRQRFSTRSPSSPFFPALSHFKKSNACWSLLPSDIRVPVNPSQTPRGSPVLSPVFRFPDQSPQKPFFFNVFRASTPCS